MAKPRAVIDVVSTEAGANEFLEQISLFVRAFRGAETRERLRTIPVADFRETVRGALHGLVPRGGAEMRPRICGIDQIIGALGHAILAHHRLGQALLIS